MLIVDKLFLWMLFYSFCGWVYESILVSVQERRPVNRGFLNGPLCPIYGVGAVGAITLLGHVHHPLALFLLGSLGASALEYATSWAMERLFHARWWDYSNFRFNINGRICLLGGIVFGVFAILIVDVIHPVVAGWTAMIPVPAVHWLSFVFAVLMAIDLGVTVAGVADLDASLDRLAATMAHYGDSARDAMTDASSRMGGFWQSGMDHSFEMMLRVRDAVGATLNRQQRRMIASFPKLSTARHDETLRDLRATFRRMYDLYRRRR